MTTIRYVLGLSIQMHVLSQIHYKTIKVLMTILLLMVKNCNQSIVFIKKTNASVSLNIDPDNAIIIFKS